MKMDIFWIYYQIIYTLAILGTDKFIAIIIQFCSQSTKCFSLNRPKINLTVRWILWYEGAFGSSRASVFQSKFENGTCHTVKGRQAIHINHDRAISRKRKEPEATARGLSCRKWQISGALMGWTLYRNRLALSLSVVPS